MIDIFEHCASLIDTRRKPAFVFPEVGLDRENVLSHLHSSYFPNTSYVLFTHGFEHCSAPDFSRSGNADDIVFAAAMSGHVQRLDEFSPDVISEARSTYA